MSDKNVLETEPSIDQEEVPSMADRHKKMAAEMFSVPESEVTPEQRRAAKTKGLGEVYGGSEARQVGKSEFQALVREAARKNIKENAEASLVIVDELAQLEKARASEEVAAAVDPLLGKRDELPKHSRAARWVHVNSPFSVSGEGYVNPVVQVRLSKKERKRLKKQRAQGIIDALHEEGNQANKEADSGQ